MCCWPRTGSAEAEERTLAGLEERILAEAADFLAALREVGAAGAVVVSDEVGLGLVPTSSLGRLFRDAVGLVNQRLAAAADRALLVVAGAALDLKLKDGGMSS